MHTTSNTFYWLKQNWEISPSSTEIWKNSIRFAYTSRTQIEAETKFNNFLIFRCRWYFEHFHQQIAAIFCFLLLIRVKAIDFPFDVIRLIEQTVSKPFNSYANNKFFVLRFLWFNCCTTNFRKISSACLFKCLTRDETCHFNFSPQMLPRSLYYYYHTVQWWINHWLTHVYFACSYCVM